MHCVIYLFSNTIEDSSLMHELIQIPLTKMVIIRKTEREKKTRKHTPFDSIQKLIAIITPKTERHTSGQLQTKDTYGQLKTKDTRTVNCRLKTHGRSTVDKLITGHVSWSCTWFDNSNGGINPRVKGVEVRVTFYLS